MWFMNFKIEGFISFDLVLNKWSEWIKSSRRSCPWANRHKKIGGITILFLFKNELKGAFPLSPEQWMEIVVRQLEILVSYKQQGKILAGGPTARSRAMLFWMWTQLRRLKG